MRPGKAALFFEVEHPIYLLSGGIVIKKFFAVFFTFVVCDEPKVAVYILDCRSVSGRRRSGRTGTVLFSGKRVGGFYNQRTDAGFPADAEYGGLAGVVPE